MNVSKIKRKIPKEQKIKLIHIIYNLHRGGAERFLVNALTHADKEKFNIQFVVLNSGGSFERDIQALNIPIIHIEKKYRFDLSLLFKLYTFLRKEKPHIVHTHLFAADTWGRIAALLARVPVLISTEHNVNEDENIVKKWVKRLLSLKTDKIVAISQAIKEYSIQEEGISEQKIQVIYSGLDIPSLLQTYPNPTFKFNAQNPILFMIGRFEKQKGHEFMIKALPEIVKEFPHLQMWFAGVGSLEEEIKQLAKEYKVDGYISYLGLQQDVFSFLEKADLFVMPSIFEGLGLAAQEALYMKKPSIVSEVGGLKEIVISNKTGLHVQPKNAHQLAEKVLYLLSHPQRAKELALKGHEDVIERFDIRGIVHQYEQLYVSVLSEKLIDTRDMQDAVVAITYRCNSRCIMCNIWQVKDNPKMQLEQYKKLPKHLKHINISGGEPFLRPNIVDIVKTIKKDLPKSKIVISSNGFATDLILQRMKEILTIDPRIGIALSIDGIEEKQYEVRRIDDGYEKILKTIRGLKEMGMKNIRIAYTAGDYNVDHLMKVYALSKQEGVDFTMAVVHNSLNYFGIDSNVIERKRQFIHEFESYIKEQLKRFTPKQWVRAYFAHGLLMYVLTGQRVLPDYSGKKHCFIDPDGRVYPCDVSTNMMGDIHDFDSFENLLKSSSAYEAVQFNRRYQKHWMVCTARMAIKSHPFKVIGWIVKSKIFGVSYEHFANQ